MRFRPDYEDFPPSDSMPHGIWAWKPGDPVVEVILKDNREGSLIYSTLNRPTEEYFISVCKAFGLDGRKMIEVLSKTSDSHTLFIDVEKAWEEFKL